MSVYFHEITTTDIAKYETTEQQQHFKKKKNLHIFLTFAK